MRTFIRTVAFIAVLLLIIGTTMSFLPKEGINTEEAIENNTEAISEDRIGSESTGYILSDKPFDYKLSVYNFVIYQAQDKTSVVALSSISRFLDEVMDAYKEKLGTEESYDLDLKNVYGKLVNGYEEKDYKIIKKNYTNPNGVEGTILKGDKPVTNESEEYLELLNEVKVSKSASYLFITEQCNIIAIYSSKKEAMSLIDSYKSGY